jgi:hypothetical protein
MHIGLEADKFEKTAPTGNSLLPAGLYHGIITRVQGKDTGDKTGHYIEVEFDITFPSQFVNRKLWNKFNIVNDSEKAVRIGKENLSDLVLATGSKTLTESDELLGKEVAIIVRIKPEHEDPKTGKTYQASNATSKYWPVGTTIEHHQAWLKSGSKKGVGAPIAAPVPPTGTPASNAPSWKRK